MLTVKELVKHYPLKAGRFSTSEEKIHALNGVSFTLGKKQTLGIVGESGCGKSTLAKTILGIQTQDSGSITLDPPDTKMQYIFQDPYLSLNPKMQVKDIITEPMRAAGIITKREVAAEAEKLLELVGLPKDWGTKYPHEFSGGQRQRI
ncbi:MAG: ATP-binding cassette domain-containing protein, partial [Spirochaetia bacterium]|nr:ATP-binding cassette domain-containing protein [Spirochaetia bacterium]